MNATRTLDCDKIRNLNRLISRIKTFQEELFKLPCADADSADLIRETIDANQAMLRKINAEMTAELIAAGFGK